MRADCAQTAREIEPDVWFHSESTEVRRTQRSDRSRSPKPPHGTNEQQITVKYSNCVES